VVDEAAFAALARSRDVVVERIATTTDRYEFAFADGSRASLDALYDVWSAPLCDFYSPVREREAVER
jgi:hypothetical protein